jgi:hypothetical protein
MIFVMSRQNRTVDDADEFKRKSPRHDRYASETKFFASILVVNRRVITSRWKTAKRRGKISSEA